MCVCQWVCVRVCVWVRVFVNSTGPPLPPCVVQCSLIDYGFTFAILSLELKSSTNYQTHHYLNIGQEGRTVVIITSNTSIQLPVLYNQEYNISVLANNCAGNSTLMHTCHHQYWYSFLLITVTVDHGQSIVIVT